jgi:hypothetical protein
MDVSKILFSIQIYFQKFVEIIPISFQPVVVLEILLLRCWSFVSHRALWGYFEAPLSLSLSLSLSAAEPVLVGLVGSVAAADHQVVEIWISS